jgi:Flp pilus assembly protein TadG
MTALCILRRLKPHRAGSTAVEFALLAPAFIAMLLGVLQVGVGMQNYNALRGLSADIARYAMIQQARGNPQSNDALQTYAVSAGRASPYLLRSSLQAVVTTKATPQVVGVTELTLDLTYQIPSLFTPLGLKGPSISYSRPIFLTTPS